MLRTLTLVCLVTSLVSQPSVADDRPDKLVIATWNLEWFFDEYQGDNFSKLAKKQSAPTRAEWEWKRNGVASAIAAMKPTILALQEVESQRILWYLTRRLEKEHGLKYHIAFVGGSDHFTEQDVAILYRSGLVAFGRRRQSQEMFNSKRYYRLSKHLFADFEWGQGAGRVGVRLLTVHLRATPQAAEIRQRQCRLIHDWLREPIERGENVVVLGDLNTEVPVSKTTPTTDLGLVRGQGTPASTDDLFDLHTLLKPDQRQTHLLPGKQFDRILVSPGLSGRAPSRGLVLKSITRRRDLCVRGQPDKDHWDVFYKIPQPERDLSDHYPLLAEFEFTPPAAAQRQ